MVSYDFLAAWYYNTYKPYADKNVYKKYKELIAGIFQNAWKSLLLGLSVNTHYSLLFNAHFYFQAAKAVMQSQDTRRLRIEGTVMEGSKPRKAAALYEDRRIPGAGLFQEWCRSLPVPIERKPSIELF